MRVTYEEKKTLLDQVKAVLKHLEREVEAPARYEVLPMWATNGYCGGGHHAHSGGEYLGGLTNPSRCSLFP